MQDRILTIEEVAEKTRKPVATLRYYRSRGGGPASFRLGRRVVYREADVDAWIDAMRAADRNGLPAA